MVRLMNLRLAAVLGAALLSSAPVADAGCAAPCDGAMPSASPWSGDPNAPSRLILAHPSHQGGAAIWAGLEIKIADGWFTYWRTPGEAGAGPRFDWGGSRNLGIAAVRWPAPEIETSDGREMNVYRHHVVLPVRLAPSAGDADMDVELRFSYAVCGEVCRPAFAMHRVRVSAKPVPETEAIAEQARLIEHFLALVPRESGPYAAGAVAGLSVDAAEGMIRFEIDRRLFGNGDVPRPVVILEAPRPMIAGATRLEGEDAGRMMFSAPVSGPTAMPPTGTVTITVIGPDQRIEQTLSLDGR